jgi:cellobiose-specific phosphotransferase system component IIB
MYTRGKYWVGILVPRSETMKKRLKKVMIEYNPAIHNIQKIDMIQSNGDNIAIEFKNIKASSRKNIK